MPIDLEALQRDPDFLKLPPAEQQDLLATAQQRNQIPAAPPPTPVEPAVSPQTPSPVQALWGAFRGEQRLPGQARAPEPGVAPEDLATQAARESTAGKVVSGITGVATDPSNIGELVGSALVPRPWKWFGGAGGAALGEGVRQWEKGEPFSPFSMLKEGIASAVPEVLESAARGTMRQVARNSPGGQRIIGSRATEEARQVPEHVFRPRPADEISEAFEQVRRTGLNIDTQDITQHLTTLSPGKSADIRNILTQLDTRQRTGGRYAQLYDALLSGKGMAGSSIGDLQTLRSDVRKYGEAIPREAGEARLLVRNFQEAIDDTIDYGLVQSAQAAQAPAIREQLHQARRDYAHRMAADDLGAMIEDKIRSSGNLRDEAFSLRGLWDELRKGRTEASRSVNRSLDMTPGARETFNTEMDRLTQHYENVALPMSDVQGIWRYPGAAAVRQGIGSLLLTERGRRMFENAILEGRGRLSPSVMATLMNEARREMMPELTQGKAEEKGVQSWFAPGGVARSTD